MTPYRKAGAAAFAALITVALSGWQMPQTGKVPFTAESRVWLTGESNVRDFECKAGTLTGEVVTTAALTSLAAVNDAVTTAAVSVPVAALDCDNDTMNEHMLKALKSGEAPEIRYSMASVMMTQSSSGAAATLKGELLLAGQTRPLELTGTLALQDDGSLKLTGSTVINMKDWGIKPPSIMLGTFKVREKVTIHYDVSLGSASTPAAQPVAEPALPGA